MLKSIYKDLIEAIFKFSLFPDIIFWASFGYLDYRLWYARELLKQQQHQALVPAQCLESSKMWGDVFFWMPASLVSIVYWQNIGYTDLVLLFIWSRVNKYCTSYKKEWWAFRQEINIRNLKFILSETEFEFYLLALWVRYRSLRRSKRSI